MMKSTTNRTLVAIGWALFAGGAAQAGWNDYPMTVKVANAKAAPRDAKTALVSFDLKWDYSWRQDGTTTRSGASSRCARKGPRSGSRYGWWRTR